MDTDARHPGFISGKVAAIVFSWKLELKQTTKCIFFGEAGLKNAAGSLRDNDKDKFLVGDRDKALRKLGILYLSGNSYFALNSSLSKTSYNFSF